jgi:KDO2-lipid IV(A) lauroyltransferase
MKPSTQDLVYRAQGAALRALLVVVAVLPLRGRQAVIGGVTGALVRWTSLKDRALDNLALVWPERPAGERRDIALLSGRNAGRILAGIWFNDALDRAWGHLPIEGEGAAALRAARAEGRGAILVTGHFGQWESIRHALRREGMEVGGLYRPNNNPYYEPIFLAGIEAGGGPIVPRGRAGMRAFLAHLKRGGVMMILMDQHVSDGPFLRFLGVPARTSLSAAEIALRFGIPLIPAFAPVEDGTPRVMLEAPIPPGEPAAMMQAFNDRLGSWVERHPSQWHWLHRRWKGHTRSNRA